MVAGVGNPQTRAQIKTWKRGGLTVTGLRTFSRLAVTRSTPIGPTHHAPGATRSLHASVVTFGREVDTELDVFLEQ